MSPSPDARRGDLNVVRTLSVTAGVARRQWLGLVVLVLLFKGAPYLAFWGLRGFAPTQGWRLDIADRIPQQAVVWATSILMAVAASRIVFADQDRGARLTPGQAMNFDWPALPGLFGAALIAFIVPIGLTLLPIERFGGGVYLLGSLALLLVRSASEAVFGPVVALCVAARVGGLAAVGQALDVTRGHRMRLFAAFALVAGVLFVANVLVSALLTTALEGYVPNASRDWLAAAHSIIWISITFSAAVFYAAWGPVLYLALRRARDGASAQEVEAFT